MKGIPTHEKAVAAAQAAAYAAKEQARREVHAARRERRNAEREHRVAQRIGQLANRPEPFAGASRPAPSRGNETADRKPNVKSHWPGYGHELTGAREGRVRNPNDQSVKVGVRGGNSGKDFAVGKGATASVYVPDGEYEIYFEYSDDPDSLYQGDRFTLAGNGCEIQLVQVVNGNYGIKKVR